MRPPCCNPTCRSRDCQFSRRYAVQPYLWVWRIDPMVEFDHIYRSIPVDARGNSRPRDPDLHIEPLAEGECVWMQGPLPPRSA